jgi:DNA-binding NarL/FixJ family response regulator
MLADEVTGGSPTTQPPPPTDMTVKPVADDGMAAKRATRQRPLSRRESEVLELLADGLGRRQIAEVLDISYETVKRHIGNAMRKYGVHTQEAAVACFVRERGRCA